MGMSYCMLSGTGPHAVSFALSNGYEELEMEGIADIA